MIPSRPSIVGSIVRKDLLEYSRDKLWMFLSFFVLFVMVGLFWILPDEVDESMTLGISGNGEPSPFAFSEDTERFRVLEFPSSDDLRSVIEGTAQAWETQSGILALPNGSEPPSNSTKVEVSIGIGFPAGFLDDARNGIPTQVEVFTTADVSESTAVAIGGLVKLMASRFADIELPVTLSQESYQVLGEDRIGDQVSIRENLRPMFVFMGLMMEMFAMSSIITREIQSKTALSVLVTPARPADFLGAKIFSGAASGFAQSAILLVALGALGANPALGFLLLALGAIMVAGLAMISGALARDFLGTLLYGMLFIFPMIVPAVAAVFPGTPPLWIRSIPSYPLIDGLIQNIAYQSGDLWQHVTVLLAWCIAIGVIAWIVLKRRVETI